MSMRDLTVQITEQGYKELQNKVGKLEKKLAKLSKKNTKVKIDSSGIDAVNKKLSSMGNLLKAGVVTAFAYKGAKAFANWVDEVENLDNKIKSTGLSAELYQSVGVAAKENGFAIEDLTIAMTKLNKKAAEEKDMRSADVRLLEFAEHIKGIDDPAKRSAAAVKYLGKSGTKLIPFLMQGAAGIREMTAAMKADGSILSQDSIDKALKVDAAFDKIGRTLESITNKAFSGITEELLNAESSVGNIFDKISNMDWESIGKGIAVVLKPLVAFSELLMEALEKIGQYSSVKDSQITEGRSKFSQELALIRTGNYKINDDSGNPYTERSYYEEKLKDLQTGYDDSVRIALTESLNQMISKSFGNAEYNKSIGKEFEDLQNNIKSVNLEFGGYQSSRKDINFSESEFINLYKKATNAEIQKTLIQDFKDIFGKDLLPLVNVVKNGVVPVGGGKFKETKEKGGGSSASGFSDPFLSTLIHFKNEFIVFADKLLRAQGIISGSRSSAGLKTVGNINIQVDVTGGSGDPQATGDAIAGAIVTELKKLVTANNSAVTAINNHAAVVKTATARTAGLNTPASSPIYQLQG